MLSHALYNIDGTAVLLNKHSIFDFPMTVSIQNTHNANYLYLGGPTVSASNYGFRLEPNQTYTAELSNNDLIYAIASASNTYAAIIYLEQ